MEHFRSIFQSFQNCPKFENLNYEVLQCLTERFFRDNPYISVISDSKFQLQPIFPYSGVTDTGEGAMGKRPPPNPSSWKSQRKTFQGKLQQTKFLYSPCLSDIQIYLESFLHWLQILAVYEHIYYKTSFILSVSVWAHFFIFCSLSRKPFFL